MAKKNFIMLELEDDKTRKIANVISNISCRKILDYLAEKEATETELSEKLSIPISTVHYNIQQLIETNLVIADEYHYSPKGKEVLHYKIANKYIIITPKKVIGITQKLKSIFPAALITAGVAGIIQLYSMFSSRQAEFGTGTLMAAKSAAYDTASENAVPAADEGLRLMAETAPAPQAIGAVISGLPWWQSLSLWFLIGALFALGVYFLISWIRKE